MILRKGHIFFMRSINDKIDKFFKCFRLVAQENNNNDMMSE